MKNRLLLLTLVSSMANAEVSMPIGYVDFDTGETTQAVDEVLQLKGQTLWDENERCKLTTEYKTTIEQKGYSGELSWPITVEGNRMNLYSIDKQRNLFSSQFILYTGTPELIYEVNKATNSCESLLDFITSRNLWELHNPNMSSSTEEKIVKHKLKIYNYYANSNWPLPVDSRHCYLNLEKDKLPYKLNLVQKNDIGSNIILDSTKVTLKFVNKNADQIFLSQNITSSCSALAGWKYELLSNSK